MGLLDALEHFGEAVTNIGEGIADVLDHPFGGYAVPMVGQAHLIFDLAELGGRAAEQAAEQASEWLGEIGAVEKFLATAHSPILQGGQRIIGGMRCTMGCGEPEDGAQFGHGARRFADAVQVLAEAGPTDDWTGGAADAFGAENGRQKRCASSMAATDRGVQEVIAREASQIEFHRGRLDDQSNWLADVGRTTFTLALVPGVGLAMKTAAEIQAVMVAVGSSAAELQVLSGEVSANASAIEGLTTTYQTVVDGTPTASIQGPGSPPPPPPGGGTDTPPEPTAPPGGSGPPADGNPPRTGSDGTGSGNGGGGAGGGATGGGGTGGGASGSSGSPAIPTPSASAMPKISQLPSSAMPRASTGSPSGGGGSPSAPSGSPSSSGTGGVPTDLAQLIQSAVQRALDQREADKDEDNEYDDEDIEDDDEDKDGVPDSEEHVDGDGVPETMMVAAAGPDGATGGRAPVHVELDVDPERLSVPMTVTLDRDRPILVSPPTAT